LCDREMLAAGPYRWHLFLVGTVLCKIEFVLKFFSHIQWITIAQGWIQSIPCTCGSTERGVSITEHYYCLCTQSVRVVLTSQYRPPLSSLSWAQRLSWWMQAFFTIQLLW